MFITELNPIVQELVQQPLAFLGGFFSGACRLSLQDEPVNSWLKKQGATEFSGSTSNGNGSTRNNGPQSIDIE